MKRFYHILALAFAALLLTACPEPIPDGPDGPDQPDESWRYAASKVKLSGITERFQFFKEASDQYVFSFRCRTSLSERNL